MQQIILSSTIKRIATEAGFDACGVAPAEVINEEDFGIEAWIAAGGQADMHYMEEHRAMRHDPTLLYPGCRSVISLLVGYKPSRTTEGSPRIAQYAYGEDYHQRLKRMLYQLAAAIRAVYPDFDARPCVDTAPISDKLWAARAGLGWIGRHTLLINPTLGSYCFIGELLTTAVADIYDTPVANRCDDCRRCIAACPNGCLTSCADGSRTSLNARQCASYHTIENRAETLPPDIHLSGYAFGCDCCQMACPYNRAAEVRYTLTDERKAELESLPSADEHTFKHFAKRSALSRIKYAQWQRNMQHKQ